ncbi:hypothetical protein [Pelagibacterium montanilacus]|uniref:hypothetical protein n=1 Tax=Pelagibacterium montanilacus TaxID=2185280 RepID=UPI000F8E93A8|nr:hypothetical protein [Pelagibacterium montanilacus]
MTGPAALPLIDLGDRGFLSLAAIMRWPRKPREAQMLISAMQLDLAMSEDGDPLTELTQSRLSDLSSAGLEWSLVGRVLLYYLMLAEHHPEKKSINKAWHLVWCDMRDGMVLVNGHLAPTSKRTLQSWWTEFLPAAHLCAAFALEQDLMIEDPRGFVGLAHALLDKAEQAGMRFSATMWRAQESWPIPPVSFEIPDFDTFGKSNLDAYRAPVQNLK